MHVTDEACVNRLEASRGVVGVFPHGPLQSLARDPQPQIFVRKQLRSSARQTRPVSDRDCCCRARRPFGDVPYGGSNGWHTRDTRFEHYKGTGLVPR